MAGIKAKSHYSGHVAAYNPASEHAFDEQYHTFNAHGYALNPNTGHDARQTDAHGPGQVRVRVMVRVRARVRVMAELKTDEFQRELKKMLVKVKG